MSFLTPSRIAAVADGRWLRRPTGDRPLAGLGIDSRGDLRDRAFLALRGANHDGHDYLPQAAAGGSRLLIVERPPGGAAPPGPAVLLVDDARRTLLRLAAARRAALTRTTVVAITGSAGKTTVKMLVDRVLAQRLHGLAAPKSFNNEIGVPLSILAAGGDEDYLVLEIGTNRPGEIDALAEVARPDIAVITGAGRAHLEGFGSVEAVAAEKAALLRHVTPGGAAVVNADAAALRPHVQEHRGAVELYGLAPDAGLRLTGRGRDGDAWWLSVNGGRRFGLRLPGRHNAVNALAAITVGRRLGLSDDAADAALRSCRPVGMRLSRDGIAGIDLFNDAYNANPESTAAALDTFAELAEDAPRRIIVLGDMLELGPAAAALHREVGRQVLALDRRLPLHRVVLVGPLAGLAAGALDGRLTAGRVTALPGLDAARAAELAAELRPGDAVLIKGSRAVRLERLVEAVRGRAAETVPG